MDGAKSGFLQRMRQRYGWLDHVIRAAARYQENHGDHYAAAIAYFSVLALVPLLLIAFSIVGFVLFRNPELIGTLKGKVTAAAPAGIGKSLEPVVDTAVEKRTTVGLIGLAGAAYSGLGWMNNLREALTAQWGQVHDKDSFLRVKAGDALALLGLGLALALSIGVTAAGTGFTTQVTRWLGLDGYWWAEALLVGIAVLLALAGNWLVFLWVLARLPREPVTLRSAARAAAIGAVGFEILKLAATLFLGSLSGAATAAIGSAAGLLVFAFLVSRFLLFVTAWAATAAENEALLPATDAPASTVIRPAVTVHSGPDGRTATGLVGAGAIFGLGLGWLMRRR